MVGRKVGIIASAAYVGEEIQVEFGALPPAFLPFRGQRLYRHQVHFLRRRADHILLTVPRSFQMSVVDEGWFAESRTGIYYFKSRELFERAFALELQHPSGSELYVAPLYNHLIADGSAVGYGKIERSQVMFCGTPAQHRAALEAQHNIHVMYQT